MKLLQLLPIGNFDGGLLRELAPLMANLFRMPTEVVAVRLDPEFAYHGERQQFHSSEILQAMQRYVEPDSWRVLGLTSVDLYIPILTFVFGRPRLPDLAVWFPSTGCARSSMACRPTSISCANGWRKKQCMRLDTLSTLPIAKTINARWRPRMRSSGSI
jgi:hypothetical protein